MIMENKQNTQQNFNEVECLVDVAKIRYEIVKLLEKNKMIRKGNINEEVVAEINPYFGRIEEGAFGVEFSYGYPVSIYTPFGKVRIGVQSMVEDRDNYIEQANFYHDMQAEFGMVLVEPKLKKDLAGEFGPYYALTSLPWKENKKLPDTFKRVNNVDNKSYAAKAETRRANEILMQASKVIAKLGIKNKKSKCVIGKEKVKTKQAIQIDDSEIGL